MLLNKSNLMWQVQGEESFTMESNLDLINVYNANPSFEEPSTQNVFLYSPFYKLWETQLFIISGNYYFTYAHTFIEIMISSNFLFLVWMLKDLNYKFYKASHLKKLISKFWTLNINTWETFFLGLFMSSKHFWN